PAADICRQYLADEERPQPIEISDTAREVLTAYENENGLTQTSFKVKKCEICDMNLPTEDSWLKHINGRKHKGVLKRRKRTSLVPVEIETPLVEKSSMATEVDKNNTPAQTNS
ncbi:hypothetical protein E0Z10_g9095, partial [Xylaria hypoxylon]